MEEHETIYPYYIAVWRRVLLDWLDWPEERVTDWIGAWVDRIQRDVHGYRDWFYHEDELYYILPLLVPDVLADRLKQQRTHRMYNDFAELLYEELKPVITGRPHDPTWGTEEFDWQAARERVEAVLRRHGVGFPGSEETTDYERRVVGPM